MFFKTYKLKQVSQLIVFLIQTTKRILNGDQEIDAHVCEIGNKIWHLFRSRAAANLKFIPEKYRFLTQVRNMSRYHLI